MPDTLNPGEGPEQYLSNEETHASRTYEIDQIKEKQLAEHSRLKNLLLTWTRRQNAVLKREQEVDSIKQKQIAESDLLKVVHGSVAMRKEAAISKEQQLDARSPAITNVEAFHNRQAAEANVLRQCEQYLNGREISLHRRYRFFAEQVLEVNELTKRGPG
jgi:hypothetical protein